MFINDNALIDFDLKGSKFAWSNTRVGSNNIQVRLDCALVSTLIFLVLFL